MSGLQVPSTYSHQNQTYNEIPPTYQRSMADESRPLPEGWVLTYNPESEHQFFVDTTSDPPRSIWHHPYDDEKYLATLSSAEREKIGRPSKTTDTKNTIGEHTAFQDRSFEPGLSSQDNANYLPPRPTGTQSQGLQKYSRKLVDRLTHTTHNEREQHRQMREQEQRNVYDQNLRMRQAFARATETGEPQYIGKDQTGRDVYLEPPYGPTSNGAQGNSPYTQGPYANPNARFLKPAGPYNRPRGSGTGRGYGLPIVSSPLSRKL